MQDYHVYAHYVKDSGKAPTSPQHQRSEPQTQAVPSAEKEYHETRSRPILTPTKIAATGLAVAHKINSYVGELTENRIAARRNQVGLTVAGFGLLAATNPIAAGIGLGLYVGNAAAQYGIKVFKENMSADYMRQLSGGTVKTGR